MTTPEQREDIRKWALHFRDGGNHISSRFTLTERAEATLALLEERDALKTASAAAETENDAFRAECNMLIEAAHDADAKAEALKAELAAAVRVRDAYKEQNDKWKDDLFAAMTGRNAAVAALTAYAEFDCSEGHNVRDLPNGPVKDYIIAEAKVIAMFGKERNTAIAEVASLKAELESWKESKA